MSTTLTWLPYGVCGAENPVRLDAEGLEQLRELVIEARLWSLCAPPLPLIGLTAVGLFATHTPMFAGQVLAACYGSCSVRPPACQVKLATGGITTIGRRLLTRPPRCSHATDGREHAMRIRFPGSAACTVQP